MTPRIIITLLISILPCLSWAEEIRLFGANDGVNSYINKIYEDSRHNVWVATRNGLSRYDGVRMNTYRHRKGDAFSLNNNIITSICELDRDNIIVSTDVGVQVYNYATDDFSPLYIIAEKGDTAVTRVSNLQHLSTGDIIGMASTFGNVRIYREQGVIKAHAGSSFFSDDTKCRDFLEDRQHRLWLFTQDRKVYVLSGKKKRQVPLSSPVTSHLINFAMSSSGAVYLATESDGLFRYSEARGCFVKVEAQTQPANICRIRSWKDGRLFVCTDGYGLQIYNERTNTFSCDMMQTGGIDLQHANVKDATCDAYGNVWVGIYWKGVLRLSGNNNPTFHNVGNSSLYHNTIGNNSVTSNVPCGNGDLWVAVDNSGLYRMTKDGSSAHLIPVAASVAPATINAMARAADGTLWLGSYVDGLYYVKPGTEVIQRSHHDIRHIMGITAMPDGRLWIATIGFGFYLLDTRTDLLTQYIYTNGSFLDQKVFQPVRYVYQVIQYGEKIISGTSFGIEISIMKGGKLLPVHSRLLRNHEVCDMKIHNGILWAASNMGLHRISLKDYSIRQYTEAEGLPSNAVNSMEIDGSKIIVGTDNGLALLDTRTNRITSYYHEDGLQGNEFSMHSSCQTNGQLYFGGTNGLTYFSLKDLMQHRHRHRAPLVLCNLYVDNTIVHTSRELGEDNILLRNINDADTIMLPHDFRHMSLELSSPTFQNYAVVYEYRLDGEEWTRVDGHVNVIQLRNLSYGTHTLTLRGRTNTAETEERTLTVIVRYPWYLSWWAFAIYLLAIVLVMWAWVMARRFYLGHRRVVSHYYYMRSRHRNLLYTMVERIQASKRLFSSRYVDEYIESQGSDQTDGRSPDEKLFDNIMKVVDENIGNSEFSIDDFAHEVGMSRALFYRKMKDLVGQSPNDYIKSVRMKKAAHMLKQGHYTISEVAYATGFRYVSTFSSTFKSVYGVSPTEWQNRPED